MCQEIAFNVKKQVEAGIENFTRYIIRYLFA